MEIIEVFKLTKKFLQRKGFLRKKEKIALDNVDLSVRKGEVFGLLGPNGAGKTTLIRLLAGLLLPTSGQGRISGYDLIKDSYKIKSRVGVIFNNERSFYLRLTVMQNLEYFASLHNMPSRAARDRILELLRFMNLRNESDVWVQNLSSGTKQRLAIAIGLLHDPEIILMDEPTRGLDPIVIQKTWDFIKKELVPKQKTILVCTNNLEEAEVLCDRVCILEKGRAMAVFDKAEFRDSLRSLFNKVILEK